jgi:penicillin-binding protein 1A
MTMTMALAKSINTVAVKLSLASKYGGRDQVVRNVAKLGMPYVKKTCSLALGDQGITVLDHVSGYATLANDGKRVKGYAITEIRTGKGKLIYSRDSDEPPAPQIFKRKAVRQLNEMLSHVVSEGTGRRATLDFTTAVGKTGTSSNYRDGWFMGYTGKYVTGVWMGNDNYQPTGRVTGGSLPAQIWHDYMVVAHGDGNNIPPIPGVPLHERQIKEQQNRLTANKDDTPISKHSSVPPKTHKALLNLIKAFKNAKRLNKNASKGALLDARPGTKVAESGDR